MFAIEVITFVCVIERTSTEATMGERLLSHYQR